MFVADPLFSFVFDRGLFGGILVIAATILSLIMFFVLKKAKPFVAIKQVAALEATILTLGNVLSSHDFYKTISTRTRLLVSGLLLTYFDNPTKSQR